MTSSANDFGRWCYRLSGAILLVDSLFGCFVVFVSGIASLGDVLIVLSVTLAFPVFLISITSRRAALISLWAFFIFQWLARSLVLPPHHQLSNPLADWYSATMLLGVVLFTISVVLAGSTDERDQSAADQSDPIN
jgi:hypothetical protein